jgi:putative ABC transport system permease protein
MRSITAVIAAALSVSIIFLSTVMYDSFLYLVDYQFNQVAQSDADIGLADARSASALYEAAMLPGVDRVEPVLGVGCDLSHGPYSRRLGITGLSSGHRLTTPRHADGSLIHIPSSGLVLSRKLAELLDAHVGDTLRVTPVRGRRETRTARVAAIADTFLGLDCYADIRYLGELVGESLAVNSVQMAVNPAATDELFEAVKQLPGAQNLTVRADAQANIEKTLVETSLFSIGILVIFAGSIALGSTVTNTLVEISDREREIATLRVLGYRPGQIAGIIFRQNALTFTIGALLGLPLGYAMTAAMAKAYNTELYRMPVVVRPAMVGLTLALACLFMAVAQVIVYRQVCKLDWLDRINVKE